jgi:hypothetical protein
MIGLKMNTCTKTADIRASQIYSENRKLAGILVGKVVEQTAVQTALGGCGWTTMSGYTLVQEMTEETSAQAMILCPHYDVPSNPKLDSPLRIRSVVARHSSKFRLTEVSRKEDS